MFVTITKRGEVPQHYNLHALPLGATFAHLLSRDELFRELKAMKVPGISPQSGHQALLEQLARFRAAHPPDPPVDTRDDAA
jgi:hypothetical protein